MRARGHLGLILAIGLVLAGLPGGASAAEPLGGEVGVSVESEELPRIAWAGNRYVVVWAHEDFEEDLDVIFKREFAADGTPLGGSQAVSGPNDGSRDRPDVAAAPNGSYAIVWENDVIETSPGDPDSEEDIMLRRYDAAGLAGPIEQVSFAPGESLTDREELEPAVAMTPGGSPVVGWWEDSLAGGQTVVRNLAPQGAPNADLPIVDTGYTGVDIVTQPDGRFVLLHPDASGAWDMRRFSALGAPVAGPVDFAGSSVLFPRMAADSTGALVATDGILPGGLQVLWRRFGSDLTALGTAFQAPGDAAVGVISAGMAPDGRFVVAYDREIPPGDNDVAVRSFGSDGTPLTAELIASVGVELNQLEPDVAVRPDGGFGVVWLDSRPGNELRARFYSASGAVSPPTTTTPAPPAPLPPAASKKKCPKGKVLKKVKGKKKCVKKKAKKK